MNHGKYGNHAMIVPWIMTTMLRNMAAMPSSWHDMTMIRHDHGVIMVRSWHGSHVFPNRLLTYIVQLTSLKKVQTSEHQIHVFHLVIQLYFRVGELLPFMFRGLMLFGKTQTISFYKKNSINNLKLWSCSELMKQINFMETFWRQFSNRQYEAFALLIFL